MAGHIPWSMLRHKGKPRSPERIPPFLREFGLLWAAHPDQRFGQLVANLCQTDDGLGDLWNWEESEWLQRIRSYKETADEIRRAD